MSQHKDAILKPFRKYPVEEAVRALANRGFPHRPSSIERLDLFADAGIDVSESAKVDAKTAASAVYLGASVIVGAAYRVLGQAAFGKDSFDVKRLQDELEVMASGTIRIDVEDMPWLEPEEVPPLADLDGIDVMARAKALLYCWIFSPSLLEAIEATRSLQHIPDKYINPIVDVLDNAMSVLHFTDRAARESLPQNTQEVN